MRSRLRSVRGLRPSREQFVSVLVAVCVLVFALPFVISLWPSQAPTGLPNGTTVAYERAELSDVDLSDCETWIDVDSYCGQAVAHLEDGSQHQIGITKDGATAGLDDGDAVVLSISTTADGEATIYAFHSVERGMGMLVIAAIVLVLVALSVGGKGLRAFASLVVSALFIWMFLVTGIHLGGNPLLYAGLTSVLVLTAVLHFTHGFSAKTLAAWVGTVCGVGSALVAGWIMSAALRLTGLDETTSAAVFASYEIDVRVLALAALLIALIGILNDITVAQASVVFSLMHMRGGEAHDHGHGGGSHGAGQGASGHGERTSATGVSQTAAEAPVASRRELRARRRSGGGERSLMRQAMEVGRDHAASAIYTVSFSVVGTSLASFVVARSYDMPLWALLQSETVANTIVQLLAGIFGLVVTMPATTFFAILFARRLGEPEEGAAGSS
ncbi:YibE/F family protein [Brevibacterium album]|uniref:YibE/F family protein n=1 Tax=Brevibacterium album TaxID=417948 RepID=UPI00041C997F|nr:YibE/F family protein [Brevibacterium album]